MAAPEAAPAARLTSLDAFRGFTMLLMASEIARLPRALLQTYPGNGAGVLRRRHARAPRVGRRDAVGPDPAVVHVHGRRGAAVLGGQPARARRCLRHAVPPRPVAVAAAGRARHLPALAGAPADLLHLRGRADADRARLPVPVPAGLGAAALAGGRRGRHRGRLLGRLRAVSAAAAGLRLAVGRRARRLAASPVGVRRALGQERQPRARGRRLVPQPVPARVAVPLQRRRLPDAELRAVTGHDDLRAAGRRRC